MIRSAAKKQFFFTFVPATATACERASTSEAKNVVRSTLGVVVHVEYTLENASDIDEAAVLTRVKQSTGGTALFTCIFPSIIEL